jgi:ABC-2 type transport system ATP-binding protein
MTQAIEARGLSRQFAGDVEAVRDLSLTVDEGEIFAFLGPNGAGKTTTIRILVTLLKPSSGSATVAGYDVVSQSAHVRKAIGVALQQVALDPLMTGGESMRLAAALHGIKPSAGAQRSIELLDELDLAEARDRRVGTYSGGMRRRLDLAMALVHEPRVLFLDEPTTGLDPPSRMTIWERVRALVAAGTTVFLTTQYLEEADRLANRVMIIDSGAVVAEGTPRSLKSEFGQTRVEVTVGSPPPEALLTALKRHGTPTVAQPERVSIAASSSQPPLHEILRVFEHHGVAVGSLEVISPTLDDVFMAKTGRRMTPVAPTRK